MKEKELKIILSIILCIILVESLDIIYFTKINKMYSEYLSFQLMNYFSVVFMYVIFAIYNYILKDKIIITNIYKYVWSILILSNVLFKIFIYKKGTIIDFLSIIFQIALLIYILQLRRE